ncbi:MAG: HAMP domain-containing histidine kinase [Calditrichales bacterium]|nr:MAG: HAMP domain-containing histidine kinase [Calditrichales bacterium]
MDRKLKQTIGINEFLELGSRITDGNPALIESLQKNLRHHLKENQGDAAVNKKRPADLKSTEEMSQLYKVLAGMNEKMTETEHKLQELSTTYDDVLGLITHEFKNILTSVHGYNMLLEDHLSKGSNSSGMDFLRSSDRLTRQLFNMTDSLFKMSLGEKGLLSPEQKLLDFGLDIMAPVIADFKSDLQSKKMKLSVKNNSTTNLIIGDEDLLNIVFRNLLMNAVKYGKNGTKIGITISTKKGNYAVTVENEVDHLPVDFAKGLFQKFRTKNVGETKGGTGLGLYNAKNIIDLHKGEIHCETRSNKYVRLTFSIPLNR